MPQPPIFASKGERQDVLIAFVVLALFGFGIYGLGYADRDDDDAAQARATTEQGGWRGSLDVFSVGAVLATDPQRENQAVPEKLPVRPVRVRREAPVEVYVPVVPIPTEPLGEVMPRPQAPVSPEVTIPAPTTAVIPQDPTNATLAFAREDIATIAEPVPSPEVQRAAKSARPALPAGSCVVIAGSFRSADNRNTMRRELIKDGYQVTAGVLNSGLYYTGIPVGCLDNPTRRRVEQELKTTYKVEPWLLRQ